jgi:membrane protein YqaA with SNARE-associated domain
LSFMESSFFPIPPDVMLAPMAVKAPARSLQLALITTVASVLGGLLGYLIGYTLFEAVEPWIMQSGYADHFLRATDWFDRFGFWAIFLAGFSPIPYKIFTIAAGSLSMLLIPFVLASIIGRGARFFLVAQLAARLGPAFEPVIRRYSDILGWSLVVIAIVIYSYLKIF